MIFPFLWPDCQCSHTYSNLQLSLSCLLRMIPQACGMPVQWILDSGCPDHMIPECVSWTMDGRRSLKEKCGFRDSFVDSSRGEFWTQLTCKSVSSPKHPAVSAPYCKSPSSDRPHSCTGTAKTHTPFQRALPPSTRRQTLLCKRLRWSTMEPCTLGCPR